MLDPAEQAELTYQANRRKIIQSICFGYGLSLLAFACFICGSLITQQANQSDLTPPVITKLLAFPIISVFISTLAVIKAIATVSDIRQNSSLSRRHSLFYFFTILAVLISLGCTILELIITFPVLRNLFNL